MQIRAVPSFFSMPSIDACAKLRIGETSFKKQCRKEGIKRWPYRKFKCIDTLLLALRSMGSRGTKAQAQAQKLVHLFETHRSQLLEDPNIPLNKNLVVEAGKLTSIKHQKRHPVNSRGQPVIVEKRQAKRSKRIASRHAEISENEVEVCAFILLSFKEN